MMDRSRLNNKPHQKFAMLIPFTNLLASNTTRAFTTNKNKPRVRMVTGKVSRIKTGFRKMFKIASTTANTKAVQKVSICMPLRTCARPKETPAITKILIRKFI
jgi:hypothetical protein